MLRRLLMLLIVLALPAAVRASPLELWIMPMGANSQGAIEGLLARFKAETGIDVHVTALDWGEAWSRISTALESGKGPDVLQLGTTWVSRFASQRKLAPLGSFTAAINPKRFLAAAWSTARVDDDPGVYAVPWLVDVRLLMGNHRWIAEQGVRPEDVATVAGFRETLAKLRAAHLMRDGLSPVFPFAIAGKSDWNIPHTFAPWIWSQGGDFIRKVDGRWRSALLDRNTVLGIRSLVGLALDGLVNPQSLREDTPQMAARFINGEHVFSFNTSDVILQSRLPEAEGGAHSSRIGREGIDTFPVPSGPAGSVAFLGGSNLAIPMAQAKNARALKLLLFLTRADSLDKYTRRIGVLPADREVMQAWAQDPAYRVLAEQVEHGRAYPNVPVWEDIEALLVEMFAAVWTLVDTAGLGTDGEELYRILVDYSARVNHVLGVEDSRSALTWDEFRATGQTGSPPAAAEVGQTSPVSTSGAGGGCKEGTSVFLVAAGALLVTVAVRRMRRR